MPFYELALIVRPLSKKELIEALRRTARNIWNEDGVIRKIDYLGFQKLPFRKKGIDEGEYFYEGSHFTYHLSLPPAKMFQLRPEFKLDLDIINATFHLSDQSKIPEDYECTLEEELLSPFYRKSVQPLLKHKNVRADVRR